MLAREPNPLLWTTFPQCFNILVQLHFLARIACLECRIRAITGELIILPIRSDNANGLAVGSRGGVVGKTGIVGGKERGKASGVLMRRRVEVFHKRGDMLGAGTVDVEQESGVCAWRGERGKGDAFNTPALRILFGVGWLKELCKQ